MLSDDDRLVKLAFVLQMSFGGSPSVYYGSEVGLFGVHDGNRQCMVWDEAKQNQDLKAHVKRMIALRREQSALKAMDIEWLDTDLESGVMAFRKTSDDKSLTFLFNFSEEPREINVLETVGDVSFDVYGGKTLIPYGLSNTVLEAFSFRIYA
jgi:glycosidase